MSLTAPAPLDEIASQIEGAKVVAFFPTCGYLDHDRSAWNLPIHGWIYEPERNSRMRRATLAVFSRYLRYKTRLALNDLFHNRTRAFFVGGLRDRRVLVRIGDQVFPVGLSGGDGHVRGMLRLSQPQVRALAGRDEPTCLSYTAVTMADDARIFSGRIQLLEPNGLSVISDIDDTIKHSFVRHRGELLANTFLRTFSPIEGAAALYQAWAEEGARFHYVSSSPWQLHEPLTEFITSAGFPEGSMHLRMLRFQDARLFKLFGGRLAVKARTIETLLQTFPHRRFILVGDSGERDPEIYGLMARRHPDQVIRILIRNVTGDSPHSPRIQKAFRHLPEESWCLYREKDELAGETARWSPQLMAPLSR